MFKTFLISGGNFMKTKLIIVEGLPGTGKSTISELAHKTLKEKQIETDLFSEGNLDHPADYDGVACFNIEQYEEFLKNNEENLDFINSITVKKRDNFFISYAKQKKELGDKFSNELLTYIYEYDIYELPLEVHEELLLNRWKEFVEQTTKEDKVYVFECCFIQNPVTVSMIRENRSKDFTINYIEKLANIIKPLNPVLIYLDQNDIDSSFKRIAEERPEGWLNGFINYYTQQGYGKENNLSGIDGTIEVLKARKMLEMEIFNLLDIEKKIIDNSNYDYKKSKNELSNILRDVFKEN